MYTDEKEFYYFQEFYNTDRTTLGTGLARTKRIVRRQIGPQDGVLMTPYPDVCRSALVRFGR